MPTDHFVRDGQEASVGTFGALDSRFLAEVSSPFVSAGGLIAGLTGSAALKAAGIYIITPAKE
jgi:hypothetical protein